MHSSRVFAVLLLSASLSVAPSLRAQQVTADPALAAEIDRRTAAIADKVTAWRHDIHQHPELGYAEKRTAALVAAHLKALGMEVQENVGGIPGVVGILKGAKPGPTVALRADMDALPVTELVDVPFKSTVALTPAPIGANRLERSVVMPAAYRSEEDPVKVMAPTVPSARALPKTRLPPESVVPPV
jgi:hypothetical protein